MNEKLIIRPTEIVSVFETLSMFPENLDVIKTKEVWDNQSKDRGLQWQ
jgi:major intracellular serine protease